jgi:hypothetical protein
MPSLCGIFAHIILFINMSTQFKNQTIVKAASSMINYALPFLSIASLLIPEYSYHIGMSIALLKLLDLIIQNRLCRKTIS